MKMGGAGKDRDSAFVIMPFRPNLDTFYEWRLKPYLESAGFRSDRIRRADQFSNTGYVMCEKTVSAMGAARPHCWEFPRRQRFDAHGGVGYAAALS